MLQAIKIFFLRISSNPLFILEIKKGRVRKNHGNVKRQFLQDCNDIVRKAKISSGYIYGEKGKFETTTIKGSNNIPPNILQRFRNVYRF